MKKAALIVYVIMFVAAIAAEELETRKTVKKAAAIEIKNDKRARTDDPETQTIIVETIMDSSSDAPSTIAVSLGSTSTEINIDSSTINDAISSSTDIISTSTSTEVTEAPEIENISVESPDDGSDSSSEINQIITPIKEAPKRKVLYINQQQSGKLNVHLELSDVSVIVIPNQKDPQLSLLNLLFRSAQKSNMLVASKKKEESLKSVDHPHDEYSKYKQTRHPDENYHLNMPFGESRAPYKVDISSTIGQQSHPDVDIMPNSHQHSNPGEIQPQFARSPIMQLLTPMQPAPGQVAQSNRIFKRSVDLRLLGIDAEFPNDTEDELTESILNSLDNDKDLNDFDHTDGSEFVLLGATENCGPGRKRNSYQICVSVSDME